MTLTRNPVGWFEIYVSDLKRAKAFYEAVFERALSPLGSPDAGLEMLAFPGDPMQAGAAGALVKHPMRGPNPEGVLIYFSCADCAVEAGRASKNGGQIFQNKRSIAPYGFIAIIGDTEGNAIGLHSIA